MQRLTRHTLRDRAEGFFAGLYAYIAPVAKTKVLSADEQLIQEVINHLNEQPLQLDEHRYAPGVVLTTRYDIRNRQLIDVFLPNGGRHIGTLVKDDLDLYYAVSDASTV
jgi:hypothetical protein